MKVPEGYVSRRQAAEMLEVNPRTVDNYADRGLLIKYGQQSNRVYFKREDVEVLSQPQPVDSAVAK